MRCFANALPGPETEPEETKEQTKDQGLLGVEEGLKDVELNQGRKRSRYTPEAKERTRDVRRKGACLRCRMLKLKCSAEDPCDRCLASATKTSERKVLSYCYCIRTRITEVNIFKHDTPGHDVLKVQANIRALETLTAGLHRDSQASLEETCNRVIKWLLDNDNQDQNSSIVSFLASDAFYDAARETVDAEMLREFRRLVLSTSLLHTSWGSGLCPPELGKESLHEISHTSGSALLQRLERLLSPQQIADCGMDSTRVIFLVLVGTLLAVSYSSQSTTSPNFPSELLTPEFRESPTLWVAMKEHLCHMLAHYLIFLASALGHKLTTDQERFLVENAIHRWNRSEAYLWAGALPESRGGSGEDPFNAVEFEQPESFTSLLAVPYPDILRGNLPQSESAPLRTEPEPSSWATSIARAMGNSSEGEFPFPFVLSPAVHPSLQRADLQLASPPPRMVKRRRVLMIGSCDGHQTYAQMITTGDNGRPSLFV